MKRFILSLLLVMICANFLAACHTVAGVGKDVKRAGEKIEGAAH